MSQRIFYQIQRFRRINFRQSEEEFVTLGILQVIVQTIDSVISIGRYLKGWNMEKDCQNIDLKWWDKVSA
jgi:hypothetical protein